MGTGVLCGVKAVQSNAEKAAAKAQFFLDPTAICEFLGKGNEEAVHMVQLPCVFTADT